MNWFGEESVAVRYAAGRTSFHPLVVDRMRAFLGLGGPLPRALDVGCGTGLSTRALTSLARSVVGLDLSASMLAHAVAGPGLSYVVGRAEELPFPIGRFDLITVSSACHWLDQGRFFAEASRVLNAAGTLVIYDNYFQARPAGPDPFHDWHRQTCLTRLPNPPRANVAIASEAFSVLGQEEYHHDVAFTLGGLVNYLLTQTNVIAAVQDRGESIEAIRDWLTDALTGFFGEGREASFRFGGPIWYLRKT